MSRWETSNSAYGAFTRLPPRSQVDEPQRALLLVLGEEDNASEAQATCSRCDGPHESARCPHFKGARDDHEDARGGPPAASGHDQAAAAGATLRARISRQPGDGSCLFHSLAHGVDSDAGQLRRDIAAHIAAHPDAKIGGNAVRDWVKWESGLSTDAYAARMRTPGQWGGAIEIAVFALMHQLPVDVFVQAAAGGEVFRRISSFNAAQGGESVKLHYGGRVHYDALEPLP